MKSVRPIKQRFWQKIPTFFIYLLFLTLVIFSGVMIYKYNQLQKSVVVDADLDKNEADQLLDRLNKIIVLPKEEPTFYTVTDVYKLSDQPFFTNAENGDRLLVFTKAKKAILFRSSVGRIIEVAPITILDKEATTSGIINDTDSSESAVIQK